MRGFNATHSFCGLSNQIPHILLTALISLTLICHPAFAEETTEASNTPTVDTSDWDWGEIDAMDDTPLSPNQTVKRNVQETSSTRLSIKEVTAPDLNAEPHKVYALFKGIPDFEVLPSIKDSEMHPCKNCHEWVKSNPSPRKLDKPHDNFELTHGLHGKGQFWCFTCHDMKNNGSLKTLDGEALAFEDAYILCSQCHVDQARDWAYGAHGKRLDNWQGKRQVYNCTACHYQHAPAFKTRDALAGPEIRQGIPRPSHWAPNLDAQHSSIGHNELWSKGHE